MLPRNLILIASFASRVATFHLEQISVDRILLEL